MKININVKGKALVAEVDKTLSCIKKCQKNPILTNFPIYNALIKQIKKDAPTLSIETLTAILQSSKPNSPYLLLYKEAFLTQRNAALLKKPVLKSPSAQGAQWPLALEQLSGLPLVYQAIEACNELKKSNLQKMDALDLHQLRLKNKAFVLLIEQDATRLSLEELISILNLPSLKDHEILQALYQEALSRLRASFIRIG